jgi:DNA-directed RNA polymerase subunit alpha
VEESDHAQVLPDGATLTVTAVLGIEPLERGFGLTLGNALRRASVLAAGRGDHRGARRRVVLFDLPGVTEDVTEIILNLKQVRLKLHGDGPKKGTFEIRGKGECAPATDGFDGAGPQSTSSRASTRTATPNGSRSTAAAATSRPTSTADGPADRCHPIDSLFSPVLR